MNSMHAQLHSPHYTAHYMMDVYGGEWFVLAQFIIVLMLLAAASVFLWRYVTRATTNQDRSDDALAIARARYARGEITKDEYQELRKTLEG